MYPLKDKKNFLVGNVKENKKQNWLVYIRKDKVNWLVSRDKGNKMQNWLVYA